jgi:hypothetical protein
MADNLHQNMASITKERGARMGRLLMGTAWGIVLAISMLAGMVDGQAMQATTTPPTNNTDPTNPVAPRNDTATPPNANDPATTPAKGLAEPAKEVADPAEETPETTVDPASLLPDLPPLRPAKASLIGGTVNKLDRVKDVLTIQVFGGGKMKIAFDTRTHFYNNTAAGTASDLKKGDRIYVDTVLDGSTVFAKTIRVKSSASAGESHGMVVSYRADKGVLELRDLLSPEPLKIHITSQTRIIEGDHASSAGKLTEGTLVAVKFGAQKEGDVASEVLILAVPGASFTFAGTVTAVDLRLGLLVLDSSVDHKTYEVSLDPSLIPADDSLRPGVDVTVLSRFDGRKYVARTVTMNPPPQR